MSIILSSKNTYQSSISTYKQRRRDYRKKHGSDSEIFKKLSSHAKGRIEALRRNIKLIERRNKIIKTVDDSVFEFIGVSAKNSVGKKDIDTTLAKNLFVRYCIERGIVASQLAEFIGLKNSADVSRYRLSFIRSFKTNPENREMWYRFKDFVKEYLMKQAA